MPSSAPPQSAPPPRHSEAPRPNTKKTNSSDGPSSQVNPDNVKNKSISTMKIIGCGVAVLVLVIIIVLMIIFCLSKHQERKSKHEKLFKSQVGRAGRVLKDSTSEETSAKTDKTGTECKNFVDDDGRKKEIEPHVTLAGIS